jgi:hypothetical protein
VLAADVVAAARHGECDPIVPIAEHGTRDDLVAQAGAPGDVANRQVWQREDSPFWTVPP